MKYKDLLMAIVDNDQDILYCQNYCTFLETIRQLQNHIIDKLHQMM